MIFTRRWVLLAVLLSFGLVNHSAGLRANEPLTVISYNIRYANSQDGPDVWSERRDTVAKTLQAADIVGLQEVLATQLDDLRERLPEFDWYGVGRDDGQSKGEMVPIGFRKDRIESLEQGTFWLSPTPESAGNVGWDAALPRIASWMRFHDRKSDTEGLFLNTHFDHRGPKARAESGKLLRSWVAEHAKALPCIVTGDFNAPIKSDPMQNLIDPKRSGETPALILARAVAASKDSGPDSTWTGFKQIEPGRRIDHILVTKPIEVQGFTTLDPRTPSGRFASDHLPVLARLICAPQSVSKAETSRSNIQRLDLNDQKQRQIVVDREEGQYLGHPTTVLLEDGRTILCVYPKGHGRGPIVMKRSLDGGLSWSERLPVPENWATSQETPTIHRVVAADGTKRLIMFSGLYPIRMAKSEDDGQTWTPLEKIGDFGGIVAMGSVVALQPERGNYLALFHDDGRFLHNAGKATGVMTLLKTFSKDGGLTWSAPETIYQSADMHVCEPGAVRSPDGRQIAVLLRENLRRAPSQIIFSDDEGKTWTPPRPLPWSLTGDRHTAKYAADGRLLISFRDVPHKGTQSETAGDWVAWVGSYDDLVSGAEGQYRVRLKDNHKAYDCAYPGVEVLPDDTFVITTYGHWEAGAAPYILSVRLKLSELDQMAGR